MKRIFNILIILPLVFTSCEKEKGGIDAPCISRQPMLITVQVKDFQFEPSTVNAIVGDTIKWQWVNGFHTTTSTSTPSGTSSWDALIDNTSSANNTFKYVIPAVGTYNYQCNYHAPGMVGTIIVSKLCP